MRRAIRDLCHPLPLGMAAVVALNDHLLKAAWPGWVTGKLSDVAGLAFFPVLLVALADVCASGALSRDEGRRRRAAWAATALTGAVFSAVQLSPEVGWPVLVRHRNESCYLDCRGVSPTAQTHRAAHRRAGPARVLRGGVCVAAASHALPLPRRCCQVPCSRSI